jgi:hypothetical protein
MGWRFRRSVKVLPGVRLNFGRTGMTSVSVGGKYGRTTVNQRGVRNSFSIRGTGLSYSTYTPHDQQMQAPSPTSSNADTKSRRFGGMVLAVVGILSSVGTGSGLLFMISLVGIAIAVWPSAATSEAATAKPWLSVPGASMDPPSHTEVREMRSHLFDRALPTQDKPSSPK